MIVPGSANPLLLGQSQGYNLTRSLRFRSSASAYLSRTPASAGSLTTWTWSAWVKRGSMGAYQTLFGAYVASATEMQIMFTSSNEILIYRNASNVNQANKVTTAVYRDPSAWYHIVVVWDTNNATASDRVKLYINGTRITSFSASTDPSSGTTSYINNTYAQQLGCLYTGSVNYPFDGYYAETNFIDGQALTPSSFGETSSTTGVWQPKRYTGTYGTNGFYLPFTDNSALTSGSNAGLGKDFSGNGNYWNTNNISITSGSTYDSMTDVPTLTSATAANFAVMNPLWKDSTTVIAQGNLNVSNGNYGGFSTLTIPTNSKFYAEFTVTETEGNQGVGILKASNAYSGVISQTDMFGSNSVTYYSTNGNKYVLGGGSTAYGSSWGTVGDVIGIAVNTVDNQITFYKNNVSQGTITGLTSGIEWVFATGNQTNTGGGAWNFGQRPFAYTPPTGYVALNTYNLPTPTIGATASSQANKYFDVALWTGANTSAGNSVTGLNFSPDFVWAKVRSQAYSHLLYDRLRGTGSTAELSSDQTVAEGGTSAKQHGYLSSFNSDGFSSTIGSLSDNLYFNQTSQTYVGWNWKANGSGSSNTAGSITSTVSANTTSGFSIVTYTGNGSAGATVGHGLGVAPAMTIIKTRTGGAYYWIVWHKSLASYTNNLYLNDTASVQADGNYTALPSSTVLTLNSGRSSNVNTNTYVAYCFAEIAGFSKFGSYTGNGSTDGPFVYTGFRPKYVMVKNSTAATWNWFVFDSARNTYNVTNTALLPNDSGADNTNTAWNFDFVSNGFKIRGTNGNVNNNGDIYIYACFAENPYKYSLAR